MKSKRNRSRRPRSRSRRPRSGSRRSNPRHRYRSSSPRHENALIVWGWEQDVRKKWKAKMVISQYDGEYKQVRIEWGEVEAPSFILHSKKDVVSECVNKYKTSLLEHSTQTYPVYHSSDAAFASETKPNTIFKYTEHEIERLRDNQFNLESMVNWLVEDFDDPFEVGPRYRELRQPGS